MTIDVKALAEAARLNAEKLAACAGHKFDDLVPPFHPTRQDFTCAVCGGRVSSLAKRWYEMGVAHGKASA